MAQKRQPNRPKVQRTCKQCGKVFLVQQSVVDIGGGLYCSRECWVPHNKKVPKTFTCTWCGKVFQRRPSRERKFCSKQCCGKSVRKNWREHPRMNVRAELARWTRRVILRDKACVRCGVTVGLQAHHVQSWSEHPELRLDIDNGVALCAVCHHFHHPDMKLGLFLSRGGKSVHRCVYCESPYVPAKSTQRTCGRRCGRMLHISRRRPA